MIGNVRHLSGNSGDQNEYTFSFSGGENHDASIDETSEAILLYQGFSFNISPEEQSLVGGTPQYTVQVSRDGTKWFDYATEFTNVSIEDAVEDEFLSWNLIRIVHFSNGATGGTVTYYLTSRKL